VHAEHSQRPPGLADSVVCGLQDENRCDHPESVACVGRQARHTPVLRGNRQLRAHACLPGTAVAALIRRRTRSLCLFHGLQAGSSGVLLHVTWDPRVSLLLARVRLPESVQTCKDHPPPHDHACPHDVFCSMELVLDAWQHYRLW
jgi:hypothetical protein